MFTYFILMLVSTLCGAFLSIVLSSQLFLRRGSIELPHRAVERLQLLERAMKQTDNEVVLINDLIETNEEFILKQLENELEQVRLEILEIQASIEVKMEHLGSQDDLIEEVINEIRSRL